MKNNVDDVGIMWMRTRMHDADNVGDHADPVAEEMTNSQII